MVRDSGEENKVFKINDIARMAGVSITTVSRVLNDSDKVSKKTRKKVLQVIQSVDYVPNEMARGLVMKSNKIIGMLIPDIFNGYYAELTTYIEPLLSEKGYSLQLCITNSEPDKIAYYIDDMIRRRVAGIIILSMGIDSDEMIRKMRNSMAVVSIEGDIEGVDRICVENKQGIYAAVENLIKNGHKKIAFVGYQFERGSLGKRVEGYRKAMTDYGVEICEQYVIDEGNHKNPGYSAALKLLQLDDPPTAVQCMNEYCAHGVYMALMEKGIRIPDDISVSAFDGQENTKLLVPRLTTVALPMRDMAKEAVELVIHNIEFGKPEVLRSVTLPTVLKTGNSVKNLTGISQLVYPQGTP